MAVAVAAVGKVSTVKMELWSKKPKVRNLIMETICKERRMIRTKISVRLLPQNLNTWMESHYLALFKTYG